MTLQEFIQAKGNGASVKEFAKDWIEKNKVNPDGWPMEFPYQGNWEDEFLVSPWGNQS